MIVLISRFARNQNNRTAGAVRFTYELTQWSEEQDRSRVLLDLCGPSAYVSVTGSDGHLAKHYSHGDDRYPSGMERCGPVTQRDNVVAAQHSSMTAEYAPDVERWPGGLICSQVVLIVRPRRSPVPPRPAWTRPGPARPYPAKAA
jgi:hypothetical protein